MEDVKGKELIDDAPTENKVSDETENHKQPSSESEVILNRLFALKSLGCGNIVIIPFCIHKLFSRICLELNSFDYWLLTMMSFLIVGLSVGKCDQEKVRRIVA